MDLMVLLLDKIGDFSVLAIIGALTWMYRMKSRIDNKLIQLELDLAKNYVTKTELKTVEDKIDNLASIMATKIDNVNNNILHLLQNKA